MGPAFFNKETGILFEYHFDYYMDICWPVSLLHYAKGDGRFPDYAPVLFPQLLGANLTGLPYLHRFRIC